jgi:GNAT superfamily N-acetyltransferase
MLIGKYNKRLKDFIDFMSYSDNSRPIGRFWVSPDHSRFEIWSIVEIDEKIVAASAIQPFEGNVARILTRFCIHPKYRSHGLIQRKLINEKTFAFQMVEEQIEYCKKAGYDHAFFSTEYNRINVIKKHIRMAKKLGYNCELLPHKYHTAKIMTETEYKDRPDCWQNICLYPFSNKEFPLVKSPHHT